MVRLKSRYLIVEIHVNDKNNKTNEKITGKKLLRSLIYTITKLYGDMGVGKAMVLLQVPYIDLQTGLALIRCTTSMLKEMVQALHKIEKIDGMIVNNTLLRVCGSRKVCRIKLLNATKKRMETDVAKFTKTQKFINELFINMF